MKVAKYPKKLTVPVEAWRVGRLKAISEAQGIEVTVIVRKALDEYEERHSVMTGADRLRRVREILRKHRVTKRSKREADPETIEEESMPSLKDLRQTFR